MFAEYENGRQTGTAKYATGVQARQPEPAGEVLSRDIPVSFDGTAQPVQAGRIRLFAGLRSDPLLGVAFVIWFYSARANAEHRGWSSEGSPDSTGANCGKSGRVCGPLGYLRWRVQVIHWRPSMSSRAASR